MRVGIANRGLGVQIGAVHRHIARRLRAHRPPPYPNVTRTTVEDSARTRCGRGRHVTIVAWRRSKRVAWALQVLRWTGHGRSDRRTALSSPAVASMRAVRITSRHDRRYRGWGRDRSETGFRERPGSLRPVR